MRKKKGTSSKLEKIGNDYEAEYKQLERDELEDMLSGELPDFASGQARWNERKNRYSNNLPLERTRVKLATRPHAPGSDYINASYIRAPPAACAPEMAPNDKAKECSSGADVDEASSGCYVVEDAEYIAAQAPLAATCGDFWRMVAERGAGLVVMLTRLREGERTKATRYWPRRVGRTIRYGEVRVRLVSVHSHYGPARDDLVVRRFLIRRVRVRPQQQQVDPMCDDGDSDCDPERATSEESEVEGEEGGEGEWQEVVHLHYQAWPDFGRPQTDSFMELLRLVDDLRAAAPHAPVVTHCSAGLGRTGVLIAAHVGLTQLRLGVARPDVYATVRHIRKQRPGMVQTLEQFAFIHEVVNALVAERDSNANAHGNAAATITTATATATTPRARATVHAATATKRCSSSPPRISGSDRSSASVTARGAFSSLGWSSGSATSSSASSLSSCWSSSFVADLMDYDTTTAAATELGLAQHQGRQAQQLQRGRQGLCSSTPAICMRA